MWGWEKERGADKEAIRIEGDNKSAQWTNNIWGISIERKRIPNEMENKSHDIDGREEKRNRKEEEEEKESELNEFFFFHFNCFHEINIKRNILCCVCLTLKVQWMCWVILYMVSHRTVERMHKSGINYKSREQRREVLSHSTQNIQ